MLRLGAALENRCGWRRTLTVRLRTQFSSKPGSYEGLFLPSSVSGQRRSRKVRQVQETQRPKNCCPGVLVDSQLTASRGESDGRWLRVGGQHIPTVPYVQHVLLGAYVKSSCSDLERHLLPLDHTTISDPSHPSMFRCSLGSASVNLKHISPIGRTPTFGYLKLKPQAFLV